MGTGLVKSVITFPVTKKSLINKKCLNINSIPGREVVLWGGGGGG